MDKVTVEHEDGSTFHVEKEEYMRIGAIVKKVLEERDAGEIQATGGGHAETRNGESGQTDEDRVHQVDSEIGEDVQRPVREGEDE